ncbi:hypothetical protein AB0K74_27090 [Streptomyces sp. NPDC056159]|uniref:hypothetical protein n=1 Tax=Streptomyces sp. NPDC056159 TaxID=3155537 RepID=UPI00341C1648
MSPLDLVIASITHGHDLEISRLSLGGKMGDGGQGEVYEVVGHPGLLYKQYRDPGKVYAPAVAELVTLRLRLDPVERTRLDAEAAWPLCRVTEGGTTTGFLMHRAPDTMTWRTSAGTVKLTELQFLLRPARAAWSAVVQPDLAQRLEIVKAFVELLGRLHRWGLVVGDLSQANLLWTVQPEVRIHLIDCDGARAAGGRPALAQADTPDWGDPEAKGSAANVDSDRYKAALVIGRVLAQDPLVTPGQQLNPLPGVLNDRQLAAVQRLFGQASGPANTRPDLIQWSMALSGRGSIPLLRAAPPPRRAVDHTKFDGGAPRGVIQLRT